MVKRPSEHASGGAHVTVGAVLAGGAAERMGGRKATVVFAGEPLVHRPLRALADAGLEALVVAKRSSVLPPLSPPVVHEPESPRHPLRGVISALQARPSATAVVVLACDMPFVTAGLVRALAAGSGTVAARFADRAHPLCARYPAEARPALEDALAREMPMRAVLHELRASYVEGPELAALGDPERLLMNLNDARDLQRAARLA